MVTVWPRYPSQVEDPMEVFDYCLTYENMCDNYLNRIGCPSHLRTSNGCSRSGIQHVASQCVCGSHDTASGRVQELITDVALARRYDLYPYTGYGTLTTVDFCSAFENVCGKMLEHVNCPVALKTNIGCATPGDYSTWTGQCSCGSYDTSLRVAEDTFDSLTSNFFYSLLHKPDPTVQVWDLCYSYNSNCNFFLDTIACPSALRSVIPCGVVDVNGTSYNPTYPYGQLVNFTSVCYCGSLQYLNERSYEAVVDALSFEQINTEYIYVPPPTSPYTLVVSSNAFNQLLQFPTV